MQRREGIDDILYPNELVLEIDETLQEKHDKFWGSVDMPVMEDKRVGHWGESLSIQGVLKWPMLFQVRFPSWANVPIPG